MSLVIRKKGNKNFFHYFSIGGTAFEYSASDLTIIIDNNKAKLRSLTGRPIALRDGYTVNQITIYDDSTGGGAETFATFILLTQRLIDLGYPAYYQDGQIILGDLISGDANNALVLGSDGKLYVPVGGGVQSVTGQSVDNTDPLNPVVNAIPLSGTEVGSPVTGDIEFNGDPLRLFSNQNNFYQAIQFNTDSNALELYSSIDGGATATIIKIIASKGIVGEAYYVANYDDNTYVQKKYVDDAIAENSPIVREKITITGSAFRTLNSSPVTLLPAPGAGKIIQITNILFFLDYGTITANYSLGGLIQVTGTVGLLTPSLNSSTDAIASYTPSNSIALTENTAIEISSNGSDATVGDSTLNVYITYEIITL